MVIEVYPNLFVGDSLSLMQVDNGLGAVNDGWYVITAARDPWHRDLLGYVTRGAPKEHAEYLFAHRERRLYLNMVDANDPAFIRDELVDEATKTITAQLDDGETKVLIHCNKGHSRSAGIALLWLHGVDDRYQLISYDDAVEKFRKIYPQFAPSQGMDAYLRAHWEPKGEEDNG